MAIVPTPNSREESESNGKMDGSWLWKKRKLTVGGKGKISTQSYPRLTREKKVGAFFFFFLSLNWISGYLIVFWINWWVQYLIVIRGRQLFMNAIFFSSAFFLIFPMIILSSIIFKGRTCVWYLVLLDILRCRQIFNFEHVFILPRLVKLTTELKSLPIFNYHISIKLVWIGLIVSQDKMFNNITIHL